MSSKVTIKRLATGVPGLDEILGGGLPEFSFNLIAGLPGCGKTTLAHQMMFAMATHEHPALYLTILGEPPLKMLRYQQQFSFFDPERVQDSIHFMDLSDETLTGDLDRLLGRISAAVEKFQPRFVFVDSFRSVVRAHADESVAAATTKLQAFVQQLGVLMTGWQATTFLVGEYFTDIDANPVFTVADGLIWMRQSIQRDSMVRKIEVMKMRGQPTLPGLHSFRIGADGITVFAPAHVVVAAPAPVARTESRMLMGIPGLDEMLGGGLPSGYSLLVAGPTGSGKSHIASSFLAEGVRAGETGVIALFEQHPNRSRNPVLQGLIQSGQVGVIEAHAPDLSIDEVVLRLTREIGRLGARRIVIDSLSGFELSIAPTFRDDFRESLSRMIAALATTGVTVLLTSELEDRYTDLRFSPYGTAFLTDAIIVLRYIEIESRLRRILGVIKVRASAHSNALREFTIDDEGLRIGEVLVGYEGLLGGRPRRVAGVGSADGEGAYEGNHR